MRLGLLTPIVTGLPRAPQPWQDTATVDDLVAVAQDADRLGYHHLTCSEHVAVPRDAVAVRGGRYWDPVATLGFLAAVTSRIRLATYVVVLGYHHPLELVKRYGTVDQVSRGRLVLGVGVGSLREEFELLGAEFAGRGARADDALRALRAALPVPEPVYAGSHYRFRDLVVDPCAVQPRVPLWVGGRTARSLRRAVTLADGWMPFGLPPARLARMLAAARRTPAYRSRPEPLEVVLAPDAPLDPTADPRGAVTLLRELAAAGASICNVRLAARSAGHYREQLAALAELAADAG